MPTDWVKNNRERVSELQREYYRRRKEKNPNYNHEMNLAFKKKHPKRYLLQNAKSRAKKKNWDFNLTEDDVIIPEKCPVLGIELVMQSGKGRNNTSPSIDRIDNSLGYTKGNIRVISWRANNLLSDGTLEEFKKIVEFLDGRA